MNFLTCPSELCVVIIERQQTGRDVSEDISMLAAMFNSQTPKSADMVSNLILLMSAAKQSGLDEARTFLSNHEAESTKSMSMDLVSELLRISLNPGKNESTFVHHICMYCLSAFKSNDTTGSRLKDLLLTVLLNILLSKDDTSSSSIPPEMMFDLWVGITEVEGEGLNADYESTVELSKKCCLRLEECLVDVFNSKDGQGAWIVYQRVCSLTPKKFWDMWLAIVQNADERPSYGTSLLQSLLEYDCSQFSFLSSVFIKLDTRTPHMKKFFSDNRLDAVRATFVLQAYKQKDCSAVLEDEGFVKAASIIGKSLISCLLGERDLSEGASLEMIIEVLETLCSNQLLLSETQEMLIEVFKKLDKGSLVLDIDLEIQLMKLAVYVESARDTKVSSLLLTISFIRCCKVLPKHIKRMMRSQKKAEAHVVESLVDSVDSMIQHSIAFDNETIALSSKVIDSCIIACLKYGMMESSDDLLVASGGCLKTIRLLMSNKGVSGSIRPSQIHAMAVSHSSFQSALSGNKVVKLELIHLLLCTLSLDCKHVKVESETWATILSAYNAGTDVADRSLRRLMFLYEQHDCGKDEVMMNDLRWGRLSKDQTEKVGEDESWEWLINAIDLDRVESTLSQFPVADTLEPTSISDVECSTTNMMQDDQEESSSVSEDDDDMTDDDESSDDSTTAKSRLTKTQGNDQWRSSGDDIRYSPGFVLPLLLAALEANLPHEDEKETQSYLENKDEDDDDPDYREETNPDQVASRRAYGNFCRRLADKGGIALAIASLSSRCPSIRKVSVAICGFFLKALQMPEAQGLKSWRERPQQEMLLNSIQRGLAVRRAIQIQKQDDQDDGIELGGMTTTQRFNIPMLPAVSAIFLAKAMLILSQPRHDMYGQMNRFFLRLTDYHGAFQDCFGLPAFLLLYCSSSDELSRCWSERYWALQTLKDGTVDEYCYRIISRHHVPELIMSSFYSLIGNPESQSEVYLTIDVIESLLQSGGARSFDHLINRHGLLSWLHGILSWREVSSSLPSMTLKCKFLKLITTAISSYRRLVSSQDNGDIAFYEKIPLSNVVIRICLSGDHDEDPANTLLETSACNALWEIHLADNESQSTSSYVGSTSLSDMTTLLKKFVHYPELFEKVLVSVCDLQALVDDDLTSARIFCRLTLSFMLEKKTDLLSDSIVLTMKRVHELMQLYPTLKDDKEIKAKIINCRRLAVSVGGGIKLWNMCRTL